MSTKNSPSGESSLEVTLQTQGVLASTKPMEVTPAQQGRRARKIAEAEKDRQWRICRATQRSMLADASAIAVAVCAQEQLDAAQSIMAERLYCRKRHDEMSDFMQSVTGRCLGVAAATVMDIAEIHRRRLKEELQ